MLRLWQHRTRTPRPKRRTRPPRLFICLDCRDSQHPACLGSDCPNYWGYASGYAPTQTTH